MLQSPFGAQNSPQGFAESARRFTVGLKWIPLGNRKGATARVAPTGPQTSGGAPLGVRRPFLASQQVTVTLTVTVTFAAAGYGP